MQPLLIVKVGSTLPSLIPARGDYEDWIASGMGLAPDRLQVASVFEGAELPDPGDAAGVVVTGSSAMVSDREPWSERTAAWLAAAVETGVPLLAICYGHQLLAHGLGGSVGKNPRGREIGTVGVKLHQAAGDDPLLREFPGSLRVQATHVESVLELPPGATLLASTDLDPHHAFSIGTAAWAVQFHPEFDAAVVRAYIEERREIIRAEGIDPESLLRDVAETPAGPALLRRFAQLLRR